MKNRASNSSNHSQSSETMSLPVVSCEGCGVCCFHMGYPAFVLPRNPMDEAEIAADPKLSQIPQDSLRYQELMAGHPGESWWHKLPDELKEELVTHMNQYQQPSYDGTLKSLDGPCIWLDLETRMCTHHQHRPNVCRDFETGSRDCLSWRDVYDDRIIE